MFKITLILDEHIEEIVRLAGECFLYDPFYLTLSDNANERLELIQTIFRKSIKICVRHGYAYGVQEEGVFVAFSLWFNYLYLKKFHTDEYNHIFYDDQRVGKFDDQLEDESRKIDETIRENGEVLYLLAIAVRAEQRGRGYASEMIRLMQQAFPHMGMFADISNRKSVKLYEHLDFKVLTKEYGCIFVRYFSDQENCGLAIDHEDGNIWLAVPEGFDPECLNISALCQEEAVINYLQVAEGKEPYFRYSLVESSPVKLLQVAYPDLMKYQRYINVNCFDEIIYHVADKQVVAYVTNKIDFPGLSDYDCQLDTYKKKKEWGIVPDVYSSIPVSYDATRLNLCRNKEESFLINRILKALDFRTTYEAGIPVKEVDNRKFKSRIQRYYLGEIRIQILKEQALKFNDYSDEEIIYGSPIEAELILSVDKDTRCGVLHLVSLSCGLLITQYLDSVSRNQIYVLSKGESTNLFVFLKDEFGIEKKGITKNFLTIAEDRRDLQNDLLASVLFCETLYDSGECLGKVVDKTVMSILSAPNGDAQYDYAAVYAYKNILIQISDSFRKRLYDRISMESVTLLYIELILFEEAAIEIANDEIVQFMGKIDENTPRSVLKKINTILSQHVKSIEFWNIQVNYPSSQKSIDDIRKAFDLASMRATIERNQKALLMIYETRSDIVDKAETVLISVIGAVFTIISVVNFITDPGNQSKLWITLLIIILAMLLYRHYLRRNMYFKENFFKKFSRKCSCRERR